MSLLGFFSRVFGPTSGKVAPPAPVPPPPQREVVKTAAPVPPPALAEIAQEPRGTPFEVDPRTAANIATLQPFVRPVATKFMQLLAAASIPAKIISGTRTYAEQDELYAQGRIKPGKIVTRAPAGYSNHNFGIAFDIGIFRDGKYLEDSPLYRQAGRIGKSLGFDWGGDWQSIQDEPHFEFHPQWVRDARLTESQMLAAFRMRVAQGRSIES